MNDSEDVLLLMEFREQYLPMWESFLKSRGYLKEWKEYIKRC